MDPSLVPAINAGDTAFVLLSAALVAIMTPGLAFFYGGLVKHKNVLTIMMQSFIAMGLVTVLWSLLTFSLAFGTDVSGVVGGLDYVLLRGVGMDAHATYGGDIPFAAFFVFQMMFAIITPALITGAFADRMNFKSYLVFLLLWSVLIYAPLAHWVWGGGFLAKLGAIDFAGGTVVHVSAGMAALASVFVLGKRTNTAHLPHNIPYVALGVGLLWFGWYGFNAGSALGATPQAAVAFVNSQIAAAAAMVAWLLLSWIVDGRPSMVGALTGVVAGLVAITPAAGYVEPSSSLIIGILAAIGCFAAVKFRIRMGWDDALDVWGCHGVGGFIGSILTGVFAAKSVGGFDGLLEGNTDQFLANLYGTVIAAAFAFVATYVLLVLLKAIMKVKVDAREEQAGLDRALHGEEAYDF
ncbi:MAG: ammonium transporter, Amt family [Candidatus Peregrinibacteria bacterium Gr01-1014_25]|nr:MAG: ammonium transporter, Amt family [Candidatus Peregrinibacteria bacterium Gr01-1014_25]